MPGRSGIGATSAAAPQRRTAHRRGLRREGDQGSRPGRVTPATVSGTMTQPTQPRRPDVPTIPVTAYVANVGGSGTVTPITTATNTADTPITTGSEPDAIAITPDGTTAYVANDGSGTVTPVTTVTNTAGTPITVGDHPEAIAITPAPPTPPLAAPSGLAATVAGPVSGPPSGVVLTWTDNATAPAATLVRVERASDPGFSTGETDVTVGEAAVTCTDTAVVEGATYYYRVRAENEASNSAWSNTVSVRVPDVISATGPGDQSSVVGDHVQLRPIQATSSTGLPLTFSASGLPAALSIDPNSGVISGTVTTAGGYTPTVTITDTSGASASIGFNWTVHADAISVTSPGSQSTYIGFPASLHIHASSGAGLVPPPRRMRSRRWPERYERVRPGWV